MQREGLARLRRHLGLKLHVRGRALSEQAQFAFGQRTQPRLGMKSQLDVAGEIALVIDVARRAVGAVRQIVQVLDTRFGAAATRAQQIPSHRQNAKTLRSKEQLYCVLGLRLPEPCHGERTNAGKRQHRRMQREIRQPRR